MKVTDERLRDEMPALGLLLKAYGIRDRMVARACKKALRIKAKTGKTPPEVDREVMRALRLRGNTNEKVSAQHRVVGELALSLADSHERAKRRRARKRAR